MYICMCVVHNRNMGPQYTLCTYKYICMCVVQSEDMGPQYTCLRMYTVNTLILYINLPQFVFKEYGGLTSLAD